MEALESDMVMAIYLFEISTVTRLGQIQSCLNLTSEFFSTGCENLVNEHYRLPPVLTEPSLIDHVS